MLAERGKIDQVFGSWFGVRLAFLSVVGGGFVAVGLVPDAAEESVELVALLLVAAVVVWHGAELVYLTPPVGVRVGELSNTFEPKHPGTRIFKAPQKGQVAREKCVCGFSTFDNVALLNLDGTGMIGIPFTQKHSKVLE